MTAEVVTTVLTMLAKHEICTTCIDVAKQFTVMATTMQLAMLCFVAHLYVTYVPSNSQANTVKSLQKLFW